MYFTTTLILFILTAVFFASGFLTYGYVAGISLLVYAVVGAVSWEQWQRLFKD